MSETNEMTCPACDVGLFIVSLPGGKVAVNAKPSRGVVFLENEYGEEIGTQEMNDVHLFHADDPMCDAENLPELLGINNEEEAEEIDDNPFSLGDADPFEGLQEIEPLGEDEKEADVLIFADETEERFTKTRRKKEADKYKEFCRGAISRRLEAGGRKGQGK